MTVTVFFSWIYSTMFSNMNIFWEYSNVYQLLAFYFQFILPNIWMIITLPIFVYWQFHYRWVQKLDSISLRATRGSSLRYLEGRWNDLTFYLRQWNISRKGAGIWMLSNIAFQHFSLFEIKMSKICFFNTGILQNITQKRLWMKDFRPPPPPAIFWRAS